MPWAGKKWLVGEKWAGNRNWPEESEEGNGSEEEVTMAEQRIENRKKAQTNKCQLQ